MYPAQLLEHFQNPRNVGELAPPAVMVEASNPACGDIMRLFVRMQFGVAAEVRYKVRGCTASIAAGSALTEWLMGKTRRKWRSSGQPSWMRPWAGCRLNQSTRRRFATRRCGCC